MRIHRHSSRSASGEALGQSEVFLEFQEMLSRAATVDRPVLLLGERGTGKEMAAARLHYLSSRWQGPLVTLNAAALPPTLIESELFGHEAGAFTGAAKRRTGRFELAHGGTLFLDEIANIPLEVQEKILRVVEYGSFERVGGTSTVEVDVRIIGATHSDLAALARSGQFKQDLLDRLSFEVLFVPPLRERKGDVLLLAAHFASRMAHELGREEIPEFSTGAVDALEAYRWPGNVRELKNVVERAVYRSDTALLSEIVFDPFYRAGFRLKDSQTIIDAPGTESKLSEAPPEAIPSCELKEGETLYEALHRMKVAFVQRALQRARFNQKQAARLLGLSYDQFRGLYRKLADDLAKD